MQLKHRGEMMRREASHQNRLMEAVDRHNERAADADSQKGAWAVRAGQPPEAAAVEVLLQHFPPVPAPVR